MPRRFEPDTKYHDERLADAQKALEELPQLSAAECDAGAKAEFDAEMASHTKFETTRAVTRQRYEEMIFRVEKWAVPERIANLKKFMLDQLSESLSFDCSNSHKPEPPMRLTGERRREQALAKASRDMAYHAVERKKEIERVNGRNQWLDTLWRSLPGGDQPMTHTLAHVDAPQD